MKTKANETNAAQTKAGMFVVVLGGYDFSKQLNVDK